MKEKKERLRVATFTVDRRAWSQFKKLILELTVTGELASKATPSSLIRGFIDSFNLRYSGKHKAMRILEKRIADLQEQLEIIKGRQ